jgi:hypothetical protein
MVARCGLSREALIERIKSFYPALAPKFEVLDDAIVLSVYSNDILEFSIPISKIDKDTNKEVKHHV